MQLWLAERLLDGFIGAAVELLRWKRSAQPSLVASMTMIPDPAHDRRDRGDQSSISAMSKEELSPTGA
jgi:hypothetical protein